MSYEPLETAVEKTTRSLTSSSSVTLDRITHGVTCHGVVDVKIPPLFSEHFKDSVPVLD